MIGDSGSYDNRRNRDFSSGASYSCDSQNCQSTIKVESAHLSGVSLRKREANPMQTTNLKDTSVVELEQMNQSRVRIQGIYC